MLFSAAGRRFALPLREVREVVVPPPSFVKVPRAPAFVRGVMNLRGRVVTAVDLACLVELRQEPAPVVARVLLLEGPLRDLGLLVGGVAGIVALSDPSPAPSGARPAVAGIVTFEGEAVTLLSVERLLASIHEAFQGTKHV